MFGSAILDVAIGVVFVFLLVSTICTAIREGLEGWLRSRSAYLDFGIRELLHDRNGTGLAAALFRHPLVHGLFLGDYKPSAAIESLPILAQGRGLPSYIPANTFAIALMDIAARGQNTDAGSSDPASAPLSVASMRANLSSLQNPSVQRILSYALDAANNDLNAVRVHIETWFDSGMERVSGWYKRSTQWIVLWIALVVTVAFNIDAVQVAQFLYRNEDARNAIVAQAEAKLKVDEDEGAEEAAASQSAQDFKRATADVEALALPIGWSNQELPDPRMKPNAFLRILLAHLTGWLLTAFAATLGAPFWFDVLNKFMVVRSTVKPHEKSREEPSKDGPSRPEPQPPQQPQTTA